MSLKQPVIGITKPTTGDNFAFAAIWLSVWLAGGKPVKLTAKVPRNDITIDGLILGGGTDVFPGHYQTDPKENYTYDHPRDEMEMKWARRALNDNIPALGICRGAQLMNVVGGGSLHMHVGQAYDDANYPDGLLHHAFYRKRIFITENTLFFRVMKCREIMVNSLHKQAVDRLAPDFEVNAKEANGVVQAISHMRHPYYLGVQFHPEFLIYKRMFRDLFQSLVNAAKENKSRENLAQHTEKLD